MRISNVKQRHNNHSITFLQIHMVFTTKYRHTVMGGQISNFLVREFKTIADELDIKIDTLHIDTDHVHMLIEYPPKLNIPEIAKRFKGRSSRDVRLAFPQLVTKHCKFAFWSIGYYACSVGEDAQERIRRYIAHHEDHSA